MSLSSFASFTSSIFFCKDLSEKRLIKNGIRTDVINPATSGAAYVIISIIMYLKTKNTIKKLNEQLRKSRERGKTNEE